MCKISDKLKLCTCSTENVYELKHYWELSKFQKSDVKVVGTLMPPQDLVIGEEIDRHNHEKLEKMLNDGNCFDVDLKLNHGDFLEIHLTCEYDKNEKVHLVYEFVYNGKWKLKKHYPFDNDRVMKQGGKVLRPFSRV